MLTNQQKALLKRAQRQAGVEDAEYRQLLGSISGVNSSTDPRMGNAHWDTLMSYLESIFWRAVDQGAARPGVNAVFRRRGYWAGRNRLGDTSRDRFMAGQFQEEIAGLETELQRVGCGPAYLRAIRSKVGPRPLAYLSALRRTAESKREHVTR